MAVDENKYTPILVNFLNEMAKQIEDYQFENRIPSRSEAIRELVRKGLEASNK